MIDVNQFRLSTGKGVLYGSRRGRSSFSARRALSSFSKETSKETSKEKAGCTWYHRANAFPGESRRAAWNTLSSRASSVACARGRVDRGADNAGIIQRYSINRRGARRIADRVKRIFEAFKLTVQSINVIGKKK